MGEQSPAFIKMTKYTPKQQMFISKNRSLFKVGSKFNSYDVNLNEDEEHDKKIRDLFFEMTYSQINPTKVGGFLR